LDAPLIASTILGIRRSFATASEPFRLGIAGEFRAGKSTLINALAGKPVAYTDVKEATPCLIAFRNGSPETATVHYEVGDEEQFDRELLNSRLANWRDDIDWVSRIAWVEVVCDAPMLDGLELWDGPGIGGGDHNERVANSFIDRITAALWVLDAELLGNAAVIEPIERLRRAGKPVVAVLNRVDGIDPESIDEALEFLAQVIGDRVVAVLPLSAKKALECALSGINDPQLGKVREVMMDRLINTGSDTRLARQIACVATSAAGAARAAIACMQPLEDRVHYVDAIERELENAAAAVFRTLPGRMEVIAREQWRDEENDLRRALESLRSAIPTGIGAIVGGVGEAIQAIAERANVQFAPDAVWPVVASRLTDELRGEWLSTTQQALELVSVASPESLRLGGESFISRPHERSQNVEQMSIEEGVKMGSAAAGILGAVAWGTAAVTWPVVLAAAPLAWLAYHQKQRELMRLHFATLNATLEVALSEVSNLATARRQALLDALNGNLYSALKHQVESLRTEAVHAEERSWIGGLARTDARVELGAMAKALEALLERCDASDRSVLAATELLLPGGAAGLAQLDQILARTSRLDLVLTGGPTSASVLAARMPADRMLRVLGVGPAWRDVASMVAFRDAMNSFPGVFEVRSVAEEVPLLRGAHALLITDTAAWRLDVDPLELGIKAGRLVAATEGRLAAGRAFAGAWIRPGVSL
jgi:hypothetical protein